MPRWLIAVIAAVVAGGVAVLVAATLIVDLGESAGAEEGITLRQVADRPSEFAGERVTVSGEGSVVMVDPDPTRRAIAQLVRAALRYGGHEGVDLVVSGPGLAISPLGRAAAPVLLGERFDELGGPAAALLIRALGGSLAVDDERLVVRLPEASSA